MTRPSTHDSRKQPQFGLPQWPGFTMDMWSPMLRGMQAWTGSTSAAIAALNSEWMEFVKQRFQADMDLPQHLTACKAPEEIWRAYVEFLEKTVDDYQKEFVELTKISGATGQGVGAIQRGLEEVPAKARSRPMAH